MKTKYYFRNRLQQTALILILITALLATTGAPAAARTLAAAGALDPAFGTNGIVITDLGGPADVAIDVAVQPDGKIVVMAFAKLDSTNPYRRTPILARYNPDGTLDTTFGTGGKLVAETGGAVALQADGKLVVGGSINSGFGLARYNPDGTLDTTFGTNGVTSAGESDNFFISFGDLVIQPDGRIVVVGTEETTGNHSFCEIGRFNGDGTLDEDFHLKTFDDHDFPGSGLNNCEGVVLQPDGKIVLSGYAEQDEGGMAITLGRITTGPDAWLDPTFGTNGHGTVVTPLPYFSHAPGALAIQADGKFVIAGNTNNDLLLARYNSNGTLDTTLGGSGIVTTDFGQTEAGNDLAIQKDGKILVVGRSYTESSSDFLLVRYNTNGSLDTGFGDAGKVITDLGSSDIAWGLALQPDGKILAAGAKDGDVALARYEGTLPPTTTATFNSKAASDGWILESTETSSVGGTLDKNTTTFYVGDDPKDKQYRSIISFNTVALPDNAFIVSAQVKIKRQGLVGTDPFTTHGNLLLDIRNGLFSNDLDVRLSDFAAAPSSSTPDTFAPLTSGWYAANLSSANLAFVNKYGVTQFRLRFDLDDNDDLSADYLKFFTGESTTANQPQLLVTYVLP